MSNFDIIDRARSLCVEIAGRADESDDNEVYGSIEIVEILSAEVEKLREERDAAFAAGMRRAAEVCKNGGADWAYDLIITDLERLEE